MLKTRSRWPGIGSPKPNQDGNPSDAVLLGASAATLSDFTLGWQTFDLLATVDVGPNPGLIRTQINLAFTRETPSSLLLMFPRPSSYELCPNSQFFSYLPRCLSCITQVHCHYFKLLVIGSSFSFHSCKLIDYVLNLLSSQM